MPHKTVHTSHNRIPNCSLLYFLLLTIFMMDTFGIKAQTDTVTTDKTFRFSTIPVSQQKSLLPYYQALREASYGTQRFEIFEQLIQAHIGKADTDSIMYYGNLYLKELANWDQTEEDKQPYYAKAYFFLGVGAKYNGLLDNGVQWHIKGVTAAERTTTTEYQYLNKIGLGKIYILKQDYTKAIALLEKAFARFGQEWPNYSNEAYINLGDAYYHSNQLKKATKMYEKAREGSKATKNLETELLANLKLGRIAEHEKRYQDAFSLYNNTRERGLAEGFNVLYFEGTIRVGALFILEENYEAAKMVLGIAYVNAMERENLHYQAEILELQRKLFADTDDYKNAYALMTQLAVVRNRINQQQQRKISKELEVQYETLQKEKEILNLKEDQLEKVSELERQKTYKNAFLIGFLVILLPVIALLYTYYQKIQAQSELAKKQAEINMQKVTSLKQEQELNLVKAAIEGQDEERKRIAQELHDSIGGNLAGIKLQLASLNEGSEELDTIGNQLDETYQLVRDISHTLIPKKFRNNIFTQLVQTYATSIASAGTLGVTFHPHPEEQINQIDEKLQMELFKIIQELMTNTLKHANAAKVDIHLSLIADELSLLFEDNGVGFDSSKSAEGIGFKNIKNRIKELSGTLHIDSALERGTVISIEIPIKKTTHEV